MDTIHIYHTNDLHSQFSNWPNIVHYINNMRKKHILEGESALYLDIGDHMDRANMITEGSMGKANVTLLNQAKYDYITIGNNEGITFTKNQLNEVYKHRSFEIILANLFDQEGIRPSWATPYTIHHLENGVRIGLIGVTAPFNDFYEPLGWNIQDPLILLPNIMNKIRSQADIIVLMSHLGLPSDKLIAEKINGIDVILGAHTHHLLSNGLEIGKTLIGQAGKFGKYIGKTTLKYSRKNKVLVTRKMEAITLPKEKDVLVDDLLLQLKIDASQSLNEVIATNDEPIPISWFEESPLAKQLALALREWCHADCSMINSGLLLGSINRGNITKGHLHEICPHPINPCTVSMNGQEITDTMQRALSDKFEQFELKGFGFRGIILGKMIYDGIEFQSMTENGRSLISSIKINGQPLEIEKFYTVATVDMFTFGQILPEVKQASHKQFYLPEMLRDVLSWSFNNLSVLNGDIVH